MANAAPVLSIGEVLIDLIATGSATSLLDADLLAVRPGGAPANVAVALARQGVPTALCSVIGRDPFGERLLNVLDANNVDRSRVRQDASADTTLAFAWKDERADGHFRLLRGADILLNVDDIDDAGISGVAAIVIGSVSLSTRNSGAAVEHAVRRAGETGIPVCFDVNMRPTIWPNLDAARHACVRLLPSTTLLKLSLDDARVLLDLNGSEDIAVVFDLLRLHGCRFIVLTDGARGAWFSNRLADSYSEPVHLPAFAIEAVEPTGAGDAFMASTIARLIERDWQPLTVEDVRYASAAGALTTTRPGAIDSLPSRSEIEAYLQSKSGK
jgi:fructokinase